MPRIEDPKQPQLLLLWWLALFSASRMRERERGSSLRGSNFKLPLSVVFHLYIRGFSLYHFSAFLKISKSYLSIEARFFFLASQPLSLFLFIPFPIQAAPCRIQQSHEGPLQLKDFFICSTILYQIKCSCFFFPSMPTLLIHAWYVGHSQ